MNKKIYIIPGWEDSCTREPYQLLGAELTKHGYDVVYKDVDWTAPLSGQMFSVNKEDSIFGFSLGAILAWMVAQQNECSVLILASMTPHYSFTDPEIKQALIDLCGDEFTSDIIANLVSETKASVQKVMYGDKEGEEADVLVRDTDHEINMQYVHEVVSLLSKI